MTDGYEAHKWNKGVVTYKDGDYINMYGKNKDHEDLCWSLDTLTKGKPGREYLGKYIGPSLVSGYLDFDTLLKVPIAFKSFHSLTCTDAQKATTKVIKDLRAATSKEEIIGINKKLGKNPFDPGFNPNPTGGARRRTVRRSRKARKSRLRKRRV